MNLPQVTLAERLAGQRSPFSPVGTQLTALQPVSSPPAIRRRRGLFGFYDPPVLTVDPALMQALAVRGMAAGSGGVATIGIASLRHGDGATTIARSVAACLATAFGKRVVLVEANLRSPSLRRICELQDGPGLSDVLSGTARAAEALRAPRDGGMVLVLPASSPAGDPRALAGSSARDLVAELHAHADTVIFDLPPIMPYPDTMALCGLLDGVAVVLHAGRSTPSDADDALRLLNETGVNLLGTVLNRQKSHVPRLLERLLS